MFTSFMSLHAQWTKTYGGDLYDVTISSQQTSDGGYILAGWTESFGVVDFDVWVLKLDSFGLIEWERTYGGSEDDWAFFIQQTSDGGYIVAGCTESFGAGLWDYWVLKLESDGDIEWEKTYGTADDYESPRSIQQTSDGGYIVGGWINKDPNTYYYDYWILKLESDGDIEWEKTYGGAYDDLALSLQQTSDGGYIVAGRSDSFNAGDLDIWILKLESDGDIEWQKTYGGSSSEYARSIRQTSDGGYIVAGWTYSFGAGKWDYWVLKLESDGDIEWHKAYGGTDDDLGRFIQETSDGGYIVAGWSRSFPGGGPVTSDVWVLKLFSNGNIEWERIYRGTSVDSTGSVQETSDGGYIVVGWTWSFADPDGDAWVLKLYSDGDIAPNCDPVGISAAKINSISISPVETDITPQDTAATTTLSSASTQETDSTVNNICEAAKVTLTISAATGGTTDPVPDIYAYYIGTEAHVEAVPDTGYRFDEWTGDVPSGHEGDNPVTILMDSNKSIEATFIRQYTLTISTGSGGTTDPSPDTYAHDTGTQTSVRAIANSGYEFSQWSGDASGTDNPITITMNADKAIRANFSSTEEEEGNGFCFIATAAYGSPFHPFVRILRDFRDTYLMPQRLGRALVDLYYKYSPSLASFIAKHKPLKIVAQINLLPLVIFSCSMLYLGPVFTGFILVFIITLPVFFVLIYRRRVKKPSKK
jgi:uncharacterized delta-60 repeat protein